MSALRFESEHLDPDPILRRMTVPEKVGQVVMALNGPAWPQISDVHMLIREYGIGSVLSCGYDAMDPRLAAVINNYLQDIALSSSAGIPLLNSGDFEQGLASQLGGNVTALPSQMALGANGDAATVEEAGYIAGREARALGFHWMLGPVADVNINPTNPVIGVRSFGDDPSAVSRLTRALIRGYHRASVLATVKHFPGHGNATVDSHQGLPIAYDDWAHFRSVHLPPFAAAIDEGTDAVMTAHIVLDAVDPDRPATLSAGVLTGLLREELGFDGIIVTDLMGMQAIAAGWTVREAAVLAFKAGADIVMAAGTTEVQVETLDTLLHAVEGGEISEERLDASVRRILRAKWRVGVLADPFVDLATVAGVGSADHQRAAVELMAGGPVLVKNDGILPFDAGSAEATLVACMTHPSTSGRTPVTHVRTIAPMVRDICGGSVMWWKAKSDAPTDDEMTEVRLLAERLDRVIVFTYTDGPPRPEQARLVQALVETGKPVVAISLGTPYDIAGYPEAPAYLASFALGFVPHHLVAPEAIRAALRIVFGAQPSGTLPVEIPGLYARGHGLRYG